MITYTNAVMGITYRVDRSFLQLCSRHPPAAFGGYSAGGSAAAWVGAWVYTVATGRVRFSPAATISVVGVILPVMLGIAFAALLPDGKYEESIGVRRRESVGVTELSVKWKVAS
ncbi:hypothetical protein L873DRAFT_516608 [Choiromyces venosus 120613-1]|uniref:Uncharacterized protein n=1 Tax=Choiromyces venosus 120613-1 TaxID=1336337 RepID=A0A3N4KI79_9PEZI|nr:hypothetical protein L873DRAFT_516608 [Choiromyces venosus 120613-1]